MASKTGVDWTDYSLNPGLYGCTAVSPACEYCYAAGMALRLATMPHTAERYKGAAKRVHGRAAWTGQVRVDFDAIGPAFAKLPKKKPARVFVTSMSDLFHEEVPFEFIARVYGAMAARPHLTFQVLTKRPRRMAEFCEWLGNAPFEKIINEAAEHDCDGHEPPLLPPDRIFVGQWPVPNVWAGTTVEDQERADERIPELLKVPAAVRWLSMEPLLSAVAIRDPATGRSALTRYGPITKPHQTEHRPGLNRKWHGIDWIVSGGESGHHARPSHPGWHRGIRDQCTAAGVAYYFKQHGDWVPEECAPRTFTGKSGYWKYDGSGWGAFTIDGVPRAPALMARVGRANDPKTIDGVKHLEFPDA